MRDIRDSPNAMSGPKAQPGLSREIQDLVQQCRVCTLHKENKPKLLIATPLPDRPWQVVATDLFELKGIDYMIVIEYFSRYIEVAAMKKTTKSSEVIRALMIFDGHGIPEQVRSDNGPQFDGADFSYYIFHPYSEISPIKWRG